MNNSEHFTTTSKLMATRLISNLSSLSLQSRLGNSKPNSFKLKPFTTTTPIFKLSLAAITVRASSTAFVETPPADQIEVQNEANNSNRILACPVCFDPFSLIGFPGLSVESPSGSSFECSTCKKTYFGNETHLELTVSSGAKNYGESMPASTEIFRYWNCIGFSFGTLKWYA